MIRPVERKALEKVVKHDWSSYEKDHYKVNTSKDLDEDYHVVAMSRNGEITCTCVFGSLNIGTNKLCSHMLAVIAYRLNIAGLELKKGGSHLD